MRRNSQLIDRSDLLTTIIEKIETSYAEDISLLICYGSYITGGYSGMSDIDFFFVPKTNRGYELEHQFILNDIGYDLWPVSWERLKKLSNLEDQPVSILMDGEVLFASSEDDLRRIEELKNKFTQNLNNAGVIRKMTTKYIDKSKAIYFGLQNQESEMFFIDAIKIVENLLIAVAILNSTYIKKGLKRIESELDRLLIAPVGFRENYRKLIRAKNKSDVQHIAQELIVETDTTCASKFENEREKAAPSELAGFYEEFKSTYNKLLLACDKEIYEDAYCAAFMIDKETQFFLTRYTEAGTFPNIINEVLKGDFEVIRASCLDHERQLISLLDKNGTVINIYQDNNEFRQYFLEKAS
jgi:hypothetical protein